VTARVKILELPERAQQLIGEDVIQLAAVDQLRAIGTVAPELLDAVIAYLDDGNAWAAERLTREPGWVLDAALTHAGNRKVFAAYLHSASSHEISELRLGKRTEQLYADAEKLHRQLDRYAYGPPQIRFTDSDVDQARAAGVLIEFQTGRPIIVDRPLYRELVKGAIKRTHDDLHAKATAVAKEKKTARANKRPADPVTTAKRERDAQLRELTDQAHGANLDLGHALVHNLTTVDPSDIDVARFFVGALLGADHASSPYTQTGSGSPASPPAASGSSSTSCAATSPRPARTAAAAGSGSTTASTATRRPRCRGCGGLSTARRRRASSMAARWSSSPPSSTRRDWSCRRASGCRPPAGARTRTQRRRRSRSSPARTSPRR